MKEYWERVSSPMFLNITEDPSFFQIAEDFCVFFCSTNTYFFNKQKLKFIKIISSPVFWCKLSETI